MSIYSNDDDIFEEYVEEKPSTTFGNDQSAETVDKVFTDIDSPFKSLIKSSSLKVNFGEAFYSAAHEWQMQGYREANNVSVLDELVRITNGEFLYRHRLAFSKETILRKKVILRFLHHILEDDTTTAVVRSSNDDFNINFTETYFSMFFKSFYNIQLDTFYQEVALYRALCDMTNTEPDPNIWDLEVEADPILSISDYINDLYIQHFDSTPLRDKIQYYVNEIFSSKK